MKRNICLMFCALALLFVGIGCSERRIEPPQYAAPMIGESKAAVVEGRDGTHVISVDGLEVPQMSVKDYTRGGNRVVLLPGHHRIVVEDFNSHSHYPLKLTYFAHTFEAGHIYRLTKERYWIPGVQLTDITSNEQITESPAPEEPGPPPVDVRGR